MTDTTQLNAGDLQSALTGHAYDGAWTLDPTRSAVALASKSVWGLLKVKGTFGDVTGEATVAGTDVSGQVRVATASINTKQAKRDTHLRSPEFFDSERYPSIVFDITGLTPSATGGTLSGSLTVRDVTRPLSVDATITTSGPSEATFTGTVTVDRAEFGMDWNQLGMASMVNILAITAVLTKS